MISSDQATDLPEDLDVDQEYGCITAPTTDPCSRCDVLLDLDCVQVEAVEREAGVPTVAVSPPWQVMGCPDCGVAASSRGRRLRILHDVPGSMVVRVLWRQRTWRYPDPVCPKGMFVEQVPGLVACRGSITTRAVTWAVGRLCCEHTTIAGLAPV